VLEGSGRSGRRAPALELARSLRSGQTEAERRLWYFIRAGRFMALKFRRQKPVGPFIVDFICLELGLVIEVDGGQHGSLADERRDRWFAERGYTVLRFWNNEVLGQTGAVLEKIRLVALSLSPNPSPTSGRGE
jgi:very-short-patch-repair endonuclease